jgi:hypothetical protein
MISLVDLASGGHEREGWEDSKVRIHENSYDILFNLQNFSENVQNRTLVGQTVHKLKEEFISASANNQLDPELSEPIREFLCEGFCLIDILDEI